MMNGDTPERAIMDGINAGAAPPSGRAIYEQRKQYGRASVNLGEISQYNVEHLTTFPIERKDGLLTVDDGIRKLKLLDARGKIWTQEALMQVDEKAVKIFDQTTQEELENFPLISIQHAQSAVDAEPYSIVAIIVKDVDQKTPDMHLFHCPNVPADIVCADIESALADCKDKKGKKIRPDTLRRTRERVEASVIPPPPLAPPPAPPMKDGNVRERIQNWDNVVQPSDIQPTHPDYAEESTEVLAAKVNRDVQILNHTLDDIEVFVSHIQKSAEALKELAQRKGGKKPNKSKRKMAGDGMLTLRSKLPPQERFIDCYRKFKLAFNLLAKLKGHIQNPNAVEIVHFLFSPLEMCIRACGGVDIPRSVESPLLTKDAIDLLHNCLTTHEAEVWGSLGDFWTKSRQEFPKEHYFPPYIPQFRSGWQPPILLRSGSDGGDGHAKELAATIAEQANRVNRAEEARRFSDSATDAFKYHVEQHVARNQTVNNTPVMSTVVPKAKMCRSLYDFTGRNKNELSIVQDELFEVLDDSKAWWKVQNKHGAVGFVPGTQMVLISHHKSPSSNNSDTMPSTPVMSSPPPTPVILAAPPPPLAPPPPMIPPPPPLPVGNTKVTPLMLSAIRRETKQVNVNGNNNGMKTNEPIYSPSKKSLSKNMSLDKLQEELRGRVNTQTAQQRNFNIPKKNAGSIALKVSNQSSSAEVKRWLESKGFTQLTVNSLGVLTGAQLFTLTRDELKMVCEEEGARVYSQLQVQKSLDNQNNELSNILRMQKEKVEK